MNILFNWLARLNHWLKTPTQKKYDAIGSAMWYETYQQKCGANPNFNIFDLRRALKWLLKYGPISPKDGICHNVILVLRAQSQNPVLECKPYYTAIAYWGTHWRYHTKDVVNPVPKITKHPRLWKGLQGALRRDFMKYMVHNIDSTLNRMQK